MAQDGAILVITCSCGQKMKVPSQAMGKTATCVKCGEKMKISVDTASPAMGSQVIGGPEAAAKELNETGQDAVVQLLLQHGLTTDLHVEQAKLLQLDIDKPLWLLLMDVGSVSGSDFHALMVKQKGIASIDLAHYNIPSEMLSFLDKSLLQSRCIIPVDRLGKLLTLAMVCPLDAKTIQDVEHITGLKVKTMLSSMQDMEQTLKSQFASTASSHGDGYTDRLEKELRVEISNMQYINHVLECEGLAPHAPIVQRLKGAQHERDRTALDLMDIVANDPVLTAMTLRVANSAAYAFPGAVDTLGLAATLLGTDALLKVASGTPGADYGQLNPPIDYQGWTLQTQFCSRAAKQIGTSIASPSANAAYSAALLHNLGRFVMLDLFPKSYAESTQSLHGQSLVERERSLYGLAHDEFGYALARKWNLPLHLAKAIRHQRTWQQATKARDVAAILALAVVMMDSYFEDKPLTLDENGDLLSHLGVTVADAGDMYRSTADQFNVSGASQGSPSPIS